MTELKKTPLEALHLSLAGKMVGFAGYSLPVHYPAGILKEHLHTRTAAGLFDVSHMGQIASPRGRVSRPMPPWRSRRSCPSMCSGLRRVVSAMPSSRTTRAGSSTI